MDISKLNFHSVKQRQTYQTAFQQPQRKVKRAELHHFADASQQHGYGTAFYLHLINDQDQIHSSFVMGKFRVSEVLCARLLSGQRTQFTTETSAKSLLEEQVFSGLEQWLRPV